jgi:hypothetical protein
MKLFLISALSFACLTAHAGNPIKLTQCKKPIATIAVEPRGFIRERDDQNHEYSPPSRLLEVMIMTSGCFTEIRPGYAARFVLGTRHSNSLELKDTSGKRATIITHDSMAVDEYDVGSLLDFDRDGVVTEENIAVALAASGLNEYVERKRGRRIAATYINEFNKIVDSLR